MLDIPEKDWKKLSSLKDILLQKACSRVLDELKPIVDNYGNEGHKAYLKLWKILNKEDDKIALMFNDLRRSNAISKLSALRYYEILPDEDFNQFSEETQNRVSGLV